MASLEHSSGALDTLPLFHRVHFVVMVEGPDDVAYWDKILKLAGVASLHVTPAGGAPELDRYTRDLMDHNTDIVVARDSHFAEVLGAKVDHPRVIYTYGHSIENSLYSNRILSEVISGFLRTPGDYSREADLWKAAFVARVRPLLLFEIANEKFQRGRAALGKSCHRLLPSAKATLPDSERIEKEVALIQEHFSGSELDEARSALEAVKKDEFWIIRGHFLTHGVLNFIKALARCEGRAQTFSNDVLYSLVWAHISLDTMDAEDAVNVRNQVQRLLQHEHNRKRPSSKNKSAS